jgi:uncharacterized membrane protein YhaH (DUF805 family)
MWPAMLFPQRLWFGMSQRVDRLRYAASGFFLMLVKYGVEALVVWTYTAHFFTPWDFLNPLLSERVRLLQPAPDWLGWAMFVWTLPFLWIAISMSVRRSADAGGSPWLGLTVLVPLVNLMFMLTMCLVASKPVKGWSPFRGVAVGNQREKYGALAVGLSLLVGGMMLFVGVYLLSSYGSSLFLGTPLVMGATAAYRYNRPYPRSYAGSVLVALASMLFAALALLLFALEGVICIAMALPLLLPIGAMGGVLGKAIADATSRPPRELLAVIVALPLVASCEGLLRRSDEYVVMSAIEIDATPAAVWQNVVRFPDLPPPTAWYFRYGIACPERARIVGQGVGATRYCEFTTGTFVEPIRVWDEPRRLAFDVTQQPAPMFELSPYRHIHPPHLDGFLRSNHGEFRLVPLASGRTRLEGRTWYQLDIFPHAYWTLWTDLLIHRIHERVLVHIKQQTEEA